MTLYAFAINQITFATDDYKSIVMQAIGFAALACLLVALVWRGASVADRVILFLCGLANIWTLLDAGGRRLPAVMGW